MGVHAIGIIRFGSRCFISCCVLGAILLLAVTVSPARAKAYGPVSVANLVEKLDDSVVNISTSRHSDPLRTHPSRMISENRQLRDVFRKFSDSREFKQNARLRALGSGFVIDESGLIVTNAHVVDGADEIFVNFQDNTRLRAEIVGSDRRTDIVVLRVRAEHPLKPVQFADSEQLRVGDWVMAVGNPLGIGESISVGIVSALDRGIGADPYDQFIQTDAAINRGNAGGPLFDMHGKVAGFNASIHPMAEGLSGIGFAVPANTVQKVVSQLIEFGQAKRGWIGISVQNVTGAIVETLGAKKTHGVLVVGVDGKGPADVSGIEVGDIITSFDGRKLRDITHNLFALIANTVPDKEVTVVIIRDGKEQSLKVSVGLLEQDGGHKRIANSSIIGTNGKHGDMARIFGAEVVELNMRLRRQLNISRKINGVVVLLMDSDSPLISQGVEIGNVIVEVALEKVSTPADILERLDEIRKKEDENVLLLISNGVGDLHFVVVSMKE